MGLSVLQAVFFQGRSAVQLLYAANLYKSLASKLMIYSFITYVAALRWILGSEFKILRTAC